MRLKLVDDRAEDVQELSRFPNLFPDGNLGSPYSTQEAEPVTRLPDFFSGDDQSLPLVCSGHSPVGFFDIRPDGQTGTRELIRNHPAGAFSRDGGDDVQHPNGKFKGSLPEVIGLPPYLGVGNWAFIGIWELGF